MKGFKDVQYKTIINDSINILNCLNLAEKNEINDCIVYIGPEILNPKRITFDNIQFVKEDTIYIKIGNFEKKEKVFF